MNDRVCLRGCTQRDVHWANCPDYGKSEPACRGCAPRECRDGSLICDKCFGRLRGLLSDLPDLLARLRSIADPGKATPTDQVRTPSTSVEPPAPVGDDLLDAIHAMEFAVLWCDVDLQHASNTLTEIQPLSEIVLDRNPLVDGIRLAWSVQDAVDRWGVERRERNTMPYVDDDHRTEIIEPVKEWGTPIVGRADAEALAGSLRTLQRWVKNGDVTPVGTIWIAGARTTLYRRLELTAARERMQGRQQAGKRTTAIDGSA